MPLTDTQKHEIMSARGVGMITMRPVVRALEDRLHIPVEVLDHGFIRIIDYMGDDAAVVQAARVSYGRGTKAANEDRGLIRYLMRHRHSTPFEMCLDGGTRVPTFPCKGAKVKHYTMRQLAAAFEEGGPGNSWAKLIRIRTVNPETGMVAATRIRRAWKSGRQKVFRLTTQAPSMRSLIVTGNHPILTPTGFQTLEGGLAVGSKVMLNGIPALAQDVIAEIARRRASGETIQTVGAALGISPSAVFKYSRLRAPRARGVLRKEVGTHRDPRAIARAGLSVDGCEIEGCGQPARDRHHIDENPHNNAPGNVARLCPKHHRHMHTRSVLEKAYPAEIASIEELDERDVFDLEVEDSNHTFVAEGIVVHNCEIKYHIKLPIFVARQWIRHRTANVNEYSARYSMLEREFYVPAPEHLAVQSAVNRQGRGQVLEGQEADDVLRLLRDDAGRNFDHYRGMLNEDEDGNAIDPNRSGLARELARMNLTLNTYTQWYWKTDLHNLMHFLALRTDPHAQYEIRVYAEAMLEMMKAWVPLCHQAFLDYRVGAVTLSAQMLAVVKRMLAGELVEQPSSGLSRREWEELHATLGRGT